MKKILFLLILLPLLGRGLGGGLLSAQTVSNLAVIPGTPGSASTVTFDVSWDKATLTTPWLDSMWVFVDYNKNGKMTRLLISGGTLTEHTATKAGTGIFIPENDMGVWVYGDARTNAAGSFSAKVQLYTKETDIIIAGACAYASSYPPVGQYVSETEIVFTGTPMYEIKLLHEDGFTVETIESGGTFLLPCSYTVSSFTDKTGAPGVFNCIRPATYTLSALPDTEVCDGTAVTLTLDGSESGWKYQLYNSTTPVGGVKNGTGSALTFSGATAIGGYSYTVRTVGGTGIQCDMPASNVLNISVNPVPANPSVTAAARCGAGTVTLYASSLGAVIDWYGGFSGGTVSLSGSNTYTTPSTTATRNFYAQARTAAGCLSASRTAVSVTINTAPGTPTITGSSSYCTSGTITATAGNDGTGIRWDNNSTTSARTVTETGTYLAVTTSAAGCTSGTTTFSVTVTQGAPAGSEPDAVCGCTSGLIDCNGTCQASTGMELWTACSHTGFTYVSNVSYECGRINFSSADKYCKDKGMRLPNLTELNCMYDNRSTLPGVYMLGTGTAYWSTTAFDNNFMQIRTLYDGGGGIQHRNNHAYFKCVKD
jgi:hypothetical protein